MKKINLLAVLLLILVKIGYTQDTSKSNPDYWTINIFIGQIQGYGYETPVISTSQTDTLRYSDNLQPVIFPVHDKFDSTKFISINQYLYDYGNSDGSGDYEIEYFPFLEKSINYYWSEMFKEIKNSPTFCIFPTKIKFNYVYESDGEPWTIERLTSASPYQYYQDAYLNKFKDTLKTTLGDSIWNSYNSRVANKRQLTILCLPSINPDFAWSFSEYVGTVVYLMYRPNHPDETNRIVAHELGHLIPYFRDNGSPSAKGFQYNGLVQTQDGLQYTGQTYGSAGCYDMMHSSGGNPGNPPNMPYGISPYFTEDIINTTMAYSSTSVIIPSTNFQHLVIGDSLSNNKTHVRLKAVREKLIPTDFGTTYQAVSLPISIDEKYSSEIGVNPDFVKNQKILLELRNGKGFDNFSPLYSSEENKGILISHIIKYPDPSKLTNLGIRITDIECATAYPDTNDFGEPFRNPDSTWTSSGNLGKNGVWYFGKKTNDWLDEHAPNDVFSYDAGKGTWYKFNETTNNLSLPTDFFNDTDRNMFTPSTRPNTNSWKGADTHIGIFIDEIEGDYADLRIYRNYHSAPLTAATAKSLPDGNNGLSIMNDGYIGERFYVDGGTWLYLGSKNSGLPDDFIPKTTLVPGTDMHVKCNGYLQLLNDSKLRLENSKLEFRTGSKFAPLAVAGIEIDNSYLNFQDGAIFRTDELYNYIISIYGASSFYSSDFYMKGSSLLTLNSGSVFTVLSGSKITFPPNSVLTLKSGSELVIEEGANLIFEEGAKIVVEGNAKITGKIIDSKVKLEFADDAVLTLSENSVLSLLQIAGYSMVLGNDASVAVSAGAHLILNSGTSSTFGTNSGIFVHRYGQLTINYSGLTSIGSWQGIIAEDSSTVSLTSSRIDKAVRGLYAIASNVSISKSTFRNCENGISLVNCSKSTLSDNIFAGIGVGAGIAVTQSPITIYNNNVSGFEHGISVTSCDKLTLIKNTITSNTAYGLYITGYNSLPLLVNAKGLQYELNNEIYGNGLGKAFEDGGQIFMKYSAGISMNSGYNNVYSEAGVYFPDVPCMRGASHLVSSKVDLPDKVFIKAEYNYWGNNSIDTGNYERLFDMWKPNERYYLDVYPYGKEAYTPESKHVEPSGNEPASPESKLLYTAVKQEQSENYTAAIKLYEQITKKYENTHEYYVAMSRLPYLYSETNLSTESLLSSYDDAYDSENTSNKKFFREMQVSVHLKNNNYDSAISVAEELKATAQSEDEILLAEIDIEIANFMKNVHGKAANSSDRLNQLVSKLNGTKDKGDGQTSISEENTLPKENILYQNYPNPFNPVTQIKFALSKTADVKLNVYNISGQLVSKLASGTMKAGVHAVDFDGGRLNSGIYYYTLETDGKAITKKMVLTK
jgi:parallel beta-helix repeat protein